MCIRDRSYAERELGMKKRSAEYYIRMYTDLTEAGVTAKDIKGIGWTKLRALTGAITPQNKKDLLKSARTMSRDDLQDHVKNVKVGKASPSADTPAMAKFPAFKMFQDRADAFQAGINAAMSTYNVDNMADALFMVMTDWQQSQQADVPAEAALEAFNARYGTDFSMDEYEDAPEEEQAATAS